VSLEARATPTPPPRPGPETPAGPSAQAADAEPRPSGARAALVALALLSAALWLGFVFDGVSPAAIATFAGLAAMAVSATVLSWHRQVDRWEARRERARHERAALEARIDILLRHANDMMVLTDEHQVLVDVNDRACEALGYAREELLGQDVRLLRDPATLADFEARTAEEIEKGGLIFETRYRRKDGSTFPVESSVRTAVVGGRRFFQGVVRDITERRRLELQLQLADRMASVGSLAAGVAHEINNPLAYLVANLDFVLTELDRPGHDEAEVRRALAEAHHGSLRVREIVRDLRSFSRGQDSARERLDVRRALQSAVSLAQSEIRSRARLALELGEVPPVLANEHRLGQALLNLLVNAAQAIPPGDPDRHVVQATTALAEDGRVAVEIADTGAGIPASALPHIFDPFFTTRPVGTGTGLGLAIVHGIVTDLGGEIRVRSEPGHGSIFTVLLPPAPPAEDPALTPPPPVAVAAPTAARILLVDDEPLVGRAVARVLSPPHQVTVATSAEEGLRLLEAGGWDAVLCDLMMPGLTGMELHARVAAARPEDAARIVFLSGGAFSDGAREFLERVPNPRVDKPFDPAALRRVVAAAVAARRAPGG
jgi:PAS domain S-box-containing protein